MSTTPEALQKQVDGKMHWDASPAEIREWLAEKHGIEGERAEEMIAPGLAAKKASIRKKSLFQLAIATVGILLFGPLLFLGDYFPSPAFWKVRIAAGAFFSASLASAGRSLYRLFSGKSDTAVDA